MEKQLSEFAFVILDATFFTARFSEDLGKQFAGMNLYVPRTFYSEYAQYYQLLSEEQREIYEQNYEVISSGNIRPVEIDTSEPKSFRSDIWGTVNVLSQMAVKNHVECLLITSNELLIQRVILNKIPVNIYHFSGRDYIPVTEQESWTTICEFQGVTGEELVLRHDHFQKELTLYQGVNDPVRLVKTDMEGAEAQIYQLAEDSSSIAKIFTGDNLKPKKIRNVRKLLEIGRKVFAPWVMFPQKELFWDRECTEFAGFVQKYAEDVEGLDQDPLYLGNPFDPYCDLNTKISVTVNRCLQLVRQIAWLNVYGLYLSDYNLANFAIDQHDLRYILMWDADSFCSRYYEPSSWVNDIQPGFLSHREETSNAEAIVNCTELLYICVFRMLTLGCRAFASEKRRFLMATTDKDNRWRKEIVPQNVWNLFEIVLRDNNRSALSVDALLHELVLAAEAYRRQPERDLSYQQVFDQCKHNTGFTSNRKVVRGNGVDDIAPGLMMLPGVFGRGAWDGYSQKPNLMKARLPYPLHGPTFDPVRSRIAVTPMHFQRCNIRPPVYKKETAQKSHRSFAWLWSVLLVVCCLSGLLFFFIRSRYFEHMESLFHAIKQSLGW